MHTLEIVEHQKANTIQSDMYLKKATLWSKKDKEIPRYYLVAFTFNATSAQRLVTHSSFYFWIVGIPIALATLE